MKTQLSAISEIFSTITAVSWGTLGHYLLLLLKQTVKEAMGPEIEPEVLIVMAAAYLVAIRTYILKILSFRVYS